MKIFFKLVGFLSLILTAVFVTAVWATPHLVFAPHPLMGGLAWNCVFFAWVATTLGAAFHMVTQVANDEDSEESRYFEQKSKKNGRLALLLAIFSLTLFMTALLFCIW